jgi:hypothetical protein
MKMKPLPHLFDLLFILLIAGILVLLSEIDFQVKTAYLFIPFVACYYLGRVVSNRIKVVGGG